MEASRDARPSHYNQHDAGSAALSYKRRNMLADWLFFIAPLIGCKVEEGSSVLQTWQRAPSPWPWQSSASLQPDEVFPGQHNGPSLRHSHPGPNKQNKVNNRAVDGIGIEPMIDSCSHNNHRTAIGIDGILRKFTGNLDHSSCFTPVIFSCHAGVNGTSTSK